MRDAAKSGMLDGFVLEYQTYINAADLKGGYVFTPFGVRHDSPLYALGDLSPEKVELIKRFAEFVQQEQYQQAAEELGFNGLEEYTPELAVPGGALLSAAQKLWKEKKNAGKPIVAVFVTDVSGSMDGEPLIRLKESLLKGQKYLGRDNSIGLVSYSSDVTIHLPIGKYDTNQQSMFVGAVNSLQSGGGTATFDGIVVALKMLQDELRVNPNGKPVIFVLSDGETNEGIRLTTLKISSKRTKCRSTRLATTPILRRCKAFPALTRRPASTRIRTTSSTRSATCLTFRCNKHSEGDSDVILDGGRQP